MKNKKIFLFLSIVIILHGFLVGTIIGKEINYFENNNSKNPIPIAPVATNYHIWGDKLYFVIGDIAYQYDISNKLEITYQNGIDLSDYYLEKTDHSDPYRQIIFHENMLFVVSQNTRIDEKINIRIVIFDLTANGIVKKRSIVYIRDNYAEILCNYQEKLIISDFYFNSLFFIDLGQLNPIEQQIGINNEIFYYGPNAILDENTLYLWDRNYFDDDDIHELISGNLLVYNIENLNNPLLKCN